MSKLYHYRAKIDQESKWHLGVYDGDTVDLVIDVGFRMSCRQRIRLLYVDTPEIRGPERPDGLQFKQLTSEWFAVVAASAHKWPLLVKTEKSDSFGRYLAEIWRFGDERSLNQFLLDNGAAEYRA